MIALEGAFAYNFGLGVAAAVNPCGFAMLPAYLMYFLGLEGSRPGTQRASLQRAFTVSAATSAGFVLVFLVVGVVTKAFTTVLAENAKYAGLAIGITLIVLGCFMLAGWKPAFATPQIGGGKERAQTFASMFGFGVAYAVASIGCTIGFLVSSILGSFGSSGYVSGVVSLVFYGLGMSLLVTALTVTLAFASGGLHAVLRSALKYMDRFAALVIMATGFYLTWYWYSDITERGPDGLRSRAERWQSRISTFLTDQKAWLLAAVFVAVIAAGVTYLVVTRPGRRSGERSDTEPNAPVL
jgi:cytochrome c biogenesis protein CcdA